MKNCRKKGERAARYALIGNRVKILRAAGNSVYPYIQGVDQRDFTPEIKYSLSRNLGEFL